MASSFLSPIWSHPIGARIAFYPSLLYGIVRSSVNKHWYDHIDEKVVLGALPFHKTAEHLVDNENVRRVVTLNEPYETRFLCPTEKQWNKMGVKQLCISTVDYNNAPTMSQVTQAIDFIEKTEHNSRVYVHCKAGRSRSATVVICYLMQIYKYDPETAIEFVKSKRPHIVLATKHSQCIEKFYKLLQEN